MSRKETLKPHDYAVGDKVYMLMPQARFPARIVEDRVLVGAAGKYYVFLETEPEYGEEAWRLDWAVEDITRRWKKERSDRSNR